MQPFCFFREFLTRSLATLICPPGRGRRAPALGRSGVITIPWRLHLGTPRLRTLLHPFFIRDNGQVVIPGATTFFLSRRRISRNIRGISYVAITFALNRARRGQMALLFSFGIFPRAATRPGERIKFVVS